MSVPICPDPEHVSAAVLIVPLEAEDPQVREAEPCPGGRGATGLFPGTENTTVLCSLVFVPLLERW